MERKRVRAPADILERKNILDRRLLRVNDWKRLSRDCETLYQKQGIMPRRFPHDAKNIVFPTAHIL